MTRREIIFLLGGAVAVVWGGLLVMTFAAPSPTPRGGVIICSASEGNTARDIDIRGPHFDKIPTDVLIARLLNGVCLAREIGIREAAKR